MGESINWRSVFCGWFGNMYQVMEMSYVTFPLIQESLFSAILGSTQVLPVPTLVLCQKLETLQLS